MRLAARGLLPDDMQPAVHSAHSVQAATLTEIRTAECHIMPCVGLAVAPAADLIATGGNDATVTIWDAKQCTVQHVLCNPEWHCDHVSVSHDGSMLAYSGAHADGRMVALEVAEGISGETGKPVVHTCEPLCHAVSCDLLRCWLLPACPRFERALATQAAGSLRLGAPHPTPWRQALLTHLGSSTVSAWVAHCCCCAPPAGSAG